MTGRFVSMGTDKAGLIDEALARLSPSETECTLCPRMCRADRSAAATGVCRTGALARISHALLHFGEEPVLSGHEDCSRTVTAGARGSGGSGTVFFGGCNLKCLFCQNYQLSWLDEGRPVADAELAAMMLELQTQGALNINFVSPTHVVLPILRALRIAWARGGISVPLVYNSNGYDSLDVVARLEGIVDIYLPDLKYASPALSARYSGAADYFERASAAVREMSVQQPVLELDARGIARKGLIVRHLVLPGHAEDSIEVLRWIRGHLSPHIGLSLMSQYRPCYKAPEEIRRPVSSDEYRRVADTALGLGFESLFLQPEAFAPDEHRVPDFDREEPFDWK
jgi:putative pyruvate formate lyase activating enzyme